MTFIKNVNISKNELGYDAWGRPKTVSDRSILHGMFTNNVPITKWYETINSVIQTGFTNCTSVDGALEIVAGATLNDVTYMRSYRNPRYQPNRGHLYSTAMRFVNPSSLMNRSFGTFTAESGAFFRLESGTLKGVVRTTQSLVTTDDTVDLNVIGIDLSKGNIYDIQYQWRGVGNYIFFINNKEVGRFSYLGTLDRLSMYNPANPAAFESENLGGNDAMVFGCVDITSEGGEANGLTYGSVNINTNSGQVAISGFNEPIIAIRSKNTINGLINTRDTLALLASAYADQRCIFRVWSTRDFSVITENTQTWTDFGDGHLEYIVNDGTGGAMDFDTTGLEPVFGCRLNQDQTYSKSALFEGRTSIYLTPGDLFVFTIHRETGTGANVGVTFEFAEEI